MIGSTNLVHIAAYLLEFVVFQGDRGGRDPENAIRVVKTGEKGR